MNEQARRWLELKHDLHDAEKRGEMELYFQPQYSLKEERIIGAEALIRWNHPRLGLLKPGEFIPIAEESGLIIPIGAWVIRAAIDHACKWRQETGKEIRLSVNISARQFRYHDLIAMLDKAISDRSFHPFYLELELTESLIMEDPGKAQLILNCLKNKGFSLAMDDFGTGYSSLAYLRRFPFDMIKIDKSFIDDIGKNQEAEAIVTAMLTLGKALGMCMVAEGVETRGQLEFLRIHECDEIQGFLYGRPMNGNQFQQFLFERPTMT
jgi:EAL domain-containing protein (putative c-di-GMP-specific phosphodiesterase class I)